MIVAATFLRPLRLILVPIVASSKEGCKSIGSFHCFVTVAGTDFRIWGHTPFWKGLFSHKFKGPDLWYEVAVHNCSS